MSKNDFSRVLLSAIDEGLCSLGNSSKEALLHGFEASFKVKRENIAQNLTEFRKTLETILGPGSRCLEEIITRHLCEKLGVDSAKLNSGDFIVSVEKLKNYLPLSGEKNEQDY